jgi:adenosylcobinamide-GDP ribazoletransferase
LEFIAAWRFLTIIPVPGLRTNTEKEIGGSLVYFPIVGAIIGLIMAGLAWLLELIVPQIVVSVLVVIATIIVTGAMHLDGLADTSDGLGGRTVAERQEIMHDSRHGTFGVTAIVGLIVLKIVTLTSLPQHWLLPALVVIPAIGRWTMMYCVTAYRYARPSGLGTIFKGNSMLSFLIGTILAAAVSVVLFYWAGLIVVILTFGIAAAAAYGFKRLFGGLTGDNYGAVNEIAEVAVLLILVILTNKNWLLT